MADKRQSDADEIYERMEKNALQDHERNQKFRKRLIFLFPYNVFLLWGTVKYAKNINKIAKFVWPSRRNFSVMNFILVGTLQALFFTSVYAGGNMLILGINPMNMTEAFKEDSDFVAGSSSIVIMSGLKYMGLSEETIKMIESDIRSQDEKARDEKLKVETAKDDKKLIEDKKVI